MYSTEISGRSWRRNQSIRSLLLANDERMRDGPYRAERVRWYGDSNMADQPEILGIAPVLNDFREVPTCE